MYQKVIKFGIIKTVILCTLFSVIVSCAITLIICFFLKVSPNMSHFMPAIIAPAVIASMVCYFLLMLLFKLESAEQTLRRLSITDELTKVFNRRYFIEALIHETARAERYQSLCTLIMIDIDNFKKINDTYGHENGDKVLRLLSKLCRSTIRKTDIFARYGGDEFMLLLPQTDELGALACSQRISDKLKKTPVTFNDYPIDFTISMGIRTYNGTEGTDSFLKRVDSSLYAAKKNK